jgi:hypothetical protein
MKIVWTKINKFGNIGFQLKEQTTKKQLDIICIKLVHRFTINELTKLG